MVSSRSPLQQRIASRIARSKRDVFLNRDFVVLSNADQVARALRKLVDEGRLVRLGRGVYAKARFSSLSKRAVLASPAGFQFVAQQALERLGVEWQPTQAQ